jgi:hypothetical protein
MQREGGTRLHYTAASYWEAYTTFIAAAWLAMSTNDPIPW